MEKPTLSDIMQKLGAHAQWQIDHGIEDNQRHDAMLLVISKLATKEDVAALAKTTGPVTEAYNLGGKLWQFFLGILGFLVLLGSAIVALPSLVEFAYHLFVPPKI